MRRCASKHRVAAVASAACLAVASALTSCSVTSAPPPGPAAHPSTSSSGPSPSPAQTPKAAPPSTSTGPAQETSPLAKDWKSYGGTAFFGCPDEFNVGKSPLEDIRPKVFDPK